MAQVWIVNPFDPLPDDREQPGRYTTLSRMLRDEGHEVTWWTASYSHRFKRLVDQEAIGQACKRERINVRFVEVPAYARNVSYRRIRSHRMYASRFEKQARRASAPDVIVASNPPPGAAAAAARIARSRRARLIVDVQDIWIENHRRMLPGLLRWAWPAILRPWIRANRAAFAAADAVVGVASGYADEPKRYGRAAYRREVIPLGIDLASFDEAARAGRCLLGEKRRGEIWAIYSGSLSGNYDVLTVARAAARVAREREDIRFIFSGRGELEPEVRRIVGGVPQVTLLGFAPFEDWAATVTRCDIAWNTVRPETLILFPNKIFYYWASGLAVLNTIPGECADWVARTKTGLTYAAGDVDEACQALTTLADDPSRLARQGEAARQFAVQTWDRQHLYKRYVDLVGELA